jgi:hypothetical protein
VAAVVLTAEDEDAHVAIAILSVAQMPEKTTG